MDMNIDVNRKANLLKLESEFDKKKDFAKALGKSAGYIGQLKSGARPLNEKTCRMIEVKMKKGIYWMDKQHDGLDDVELDTSKDEVLVQPLLHSESQGNANTLDNNNMGESVKKAWIEDNGYTFEQLKSMIYHRDNMHRSYLIGDKLIINQGFDGNYTDGSVYAFKHSDGMPVLIRVFVKMNGSLVLSNDNSSAYPDELVDSDSVDDLPLLGSIVRMTRDTN